MTIIIKCKQRYLYTTWYSYLLGDNSESYEGITTKNFWRKRLDFSGDPFVNISSKSFIIIVWVILLTKVDSPKERNFRRADVMIDNDNFLTAHWSTCRLPSQSSNAPWLRSRDNQLVLLHKYGNRRNVLSKTYEYEYSSHWKTGAGKLPSFI